MEQWSAELVDLQELGLAETEVRIRIQPWVKVLSAIGGGLGIYHGYKRTGSGWWAAGYGLFGSVMPVVAVPVMFIQGFGKKKDE